MKTPSLTWKRGFMRIWITIAIFWSAYAAFQTWNDVSYTFQYYLHDADLVERAQQKNAKAIRTAREELARLPRAKAAAKAKLESLPNPEEGQNVSALERMLLEATVNRDPRDLEKQIVALEQTAPRPAPPRFEWILFITIPPLILAALTVLLFYIGKWLYLGFTAPK